MKKSFKYCAIAIAISSVLTGCNDEDTTNSNNNNGNPYVVPIASDISISGDSYVNSTLTGEYKFIDPNYSPRAEGASAYSWKVDDLDGDRTNDVAITGANERTLLLADNQLDQSVYLCVTPEATGNTNTTGETKCSTAKLVQSANGSKPSATSAVIDNTTPTVGDTLTGSYDYADADNDLESGSTFRWKASANDITGATSITHTLTNQQEGKVIEFCVTPTSANPDSISNYPTIGDEVCSAVDTDAVQEKVGDAPTANNIVITGDHTVGSTLTPTYAFSDADNDAQGSSTFSWKRGSIEVATTLAYELVSADVGANITFTVTPVSATGLPTNGTPVESGAITDVAQPSGPTPTISLKAVDKAGKAYPEINDTLTGGYTYTPSITNSADESTAVWKAAGVPITDVTCTTGSDCSLTLTDTYYNKDLTYCVTPKAVDSSAGTEKCSAIEKVYGVKLSGTLEFGKELKLDISGYNNPKVEWKVDVSDIEGPTSDDNRTPRNPVKTGEAAKTFLIGAEVLKQIINTDQASLLDLDATIGNKNGIVDDADWAQASLLGNVTMDSGSVDANAINAANYVGKEVEVTVTFTESNVDPVTLIASKTTEVLGGVYYDTSDATKRGIEPVRELVFGTLVYHRPLTVAEATHKAAVGFGANVAYPRYSKPSAGINWGLYRAIKDASDTADKYNSDFPAVESCLNLYDEAAKDVWHLPASRYDSAYTANGFAAQGNKPPMETADEKYSLIQLASAINKSDNTVRNGLLGTYIDRTTPNEKLNYTISPTTGWLLNGNTGLTAFWSATKPNSSSSTANSVLFTESGGSGNNGLTNGRFVSCVRAK